MENAVPAFILLTGNGKGKTTSAVGQAVRAAGRGMRVAFLQFLKTGNTGEKDELQKLGVTWENFGAGFLWNDADLQKTRPLVLEGWKRAAGCLTSGEYDLVILDEFTYVLSAGIIAAADFRGFIESSRSKQGFPSLVVTGRNAPEEILPLFDIISTVECTSHKCLKHPDGIES